MNDAVKQSFSAWLDDEASELDMQRLLSSLECSPKLIEPLREHARQHALRQGLPQIDVLDALQAKLADVPQPASVQPKARQSWGLSLAVAASVALIAVLGARLWYASGIEQPAAQIAVEEEAPLPQYSGQQFIALEHLRRLMQRHAQQAAYHSGRVAMPYRVSESEP